MELITHLHVAGELCAVHLLGVCRANNLTTTSRQRSSSPAYMSAGVLQCTIAVLMLKLMLALELTLWLTVQLTNSS